MKRSNDISVLQQLNYDILKIWNNMKVLSRSLKPGIAPDQVSCLNYYTIRAVSFDDVSCKLTVTRRRLSLDYPAFATYFTKEMNLFNDELPESEYFDLEVILDKYDYLNKTKSHRVLTQWSEALEAIKLELDDCLRDLRRVARWNARVEDISWLATLMRRTLFLKVEVTMRSRE
jgi:hypothetical protein